MVSWPFKLGYRRLLTRNRYTPLGCLSEVQKIFVYLYLDFSQFSVFQLSTIYASKLNLKMIIKRSTNLYFWRFLMPFRRDAYPDPPPSVRS